MAKPIITSWAFQLTLLHNHVPIYNILKDVIDGDEGRLKAMRRGLIEGGYESTAVKSGAINQLEALLSKLLFVLQTRGMGYRCILTRHSSKLFVLHQIVLHQIEMNTVWAWFMCEPKTKQAVYQGLQNGWGVPDVSS